MNTAEVIESCRELPGVTVIERENGAELLLSQREGSGRMRFVPMFPGIMLALISVRAPSWPAPVLMDGTPEARGPLILNYCTGGRCELVLNDSRSVFLTSGHIALTALSFLSIRRRRRKIPSCGAALAWIFPPCGSGIVRTERP